MVDVGGDLTFNRGSLCRLSNLGTDEEMGGWQTLFSSASLRLVRNTDKRNFQLVVDDLSSVGAPQPGAYVAPGELTMDLSLSLQFRSTCIDALQPLASQYFPALSKSSVHSSSSSPSVLLQQEQAQLQDVCFVWVDKLANKIQHLYAFVLEAVSTQVLLSLSLVFVLSLTHRLTLSGCV